MVGMGNNTSHSLYRILRTCQELLLSLTFNRLMSGIHVVQVISQYPHLPKQHVEAFADNHKFLKYSDPG